MKLNREPARPARARQRSCLAARGAGGVSEWTEYQRERHERSDPDRSCRSPLLLIRIIRIIRGFPSHLPGRSFREDVDGFAVELDRVVRSVDPVSLAIEQLYLTGRKLPGLGITMRIGDTRMRTVGIVEPVDR